jgi:hypothetical protein
VEPLRVTAKLWNDIVLPSGGIALDAILYSMHALVNRLPAVDVSKEPEPLPIPIAREPSGRFFLASFAVPTVDQHETVYYHKHFPRSEAVHRCQKLKRVDMATGPDKSCRKPLDVVHVVGDELVWWCIGDKAGIESLVQYCHHLGHKRTHGMGKIREWIVEPCEPWGDDFPIVLSGRPLRPLPIGWPGVVEHDAATMRLMPPYWPSAPGAQPCLMPLLPEDACEL